MEKFLFYSVIYLHLFNSFIYCEDDLQNHRLELLEQSARNFILETKPKVLMLQNEVQKLNSENDYMQRKILRQDRQLEDTVWALENLRSLSLTQEERDLVTELKWTIFDLKQETAALQEDVCLKDAACSEWTGWSQCSVECDTGTRIRARKCETVGRFQSMCSPDTIEEVPCTMQKCEIPNEVPKSYCQEDYVLFQGFCLRFSERQDSRLLSRKICEADDAHLVFIGDKDKQKIVRDFINIYAPKFMPDRNEDFSKREYWDFKGIPKKTNIAIDGIRHHQKRKFVNWKSETMTYFNWAIGQPRNDISDGDYCVTFNVLTGEWYMNCCSVTFFYLCEANTL